MAVLINFKICSNDSPCNVPPVCPTGAVWWDAAEKTLKIDNSKCISCGACMRVCPIAAIRVAKSKAEADKIQAEFDADPRKTEDLKIDRYGAGVFSTPALQPAEAVAFAAASKGLLCLELQLAFEDMPCHLLSIPMSELLDLKTTTYRAVANGAEVAEKFGVSEIPALVFFKDGKQIGKVEGYFGDNEEGTGAEKTFLRNKIKDVLKNA